MLRAAASLSLISPVVALLIVVGLCAELARLQEGSSDPWYSRFFGRLSMQVVVDCGPPMSALTLVLSYTNAAPITFSRQGESMMGARSENNGREQLQSAPNAGGREPKSLPFTERLSCTIDEACEATGLGRTKLYELIGAGQIATTTVGRRRLVMVQSLIALLCTPVSA